MYKYWIDYLVLFITLMLLWVLNWMCIYKLLFGANVMSVRGTFLLLDYPQFYPSTDASFIHSE